MKRRVIGVASLILTITFTPSCGSATGPLESPPTRITIEGPDSVAVADTASFTSKVFDADGGEIRALRPAWQADNPDVANPLGNGRFVALSAGQTQITASVGAVRAVKTLTVVPRTQSAAD